VSEPQPVRFHTVGDDRAPSPRRTTLPPSRRLSLDRDYDAVYAAKMRKSAGGVTVWTRPNGLAFHRLGLSVGKRAGKAHDRVHIKRLIREAFRLNQHDLAHGAGRHDIVVSARGADGLTLESCASAMIDLVAQADREWSKRQETKRRNEIGTEPRRHEGTE
jgi:ribonuclease P protein component